ncbi:MAG: NAD(P)/FAD-dependent oxidoreductase [Bacteroidota bacterium]
MENHTVLETDYLIVGSGAVGMAFADVLLTETEANILLVDRYGKPGGHWNMAYPFVRLHQPSAFYGVSSKELSKGRLDQAGLNKGMNDLATGAEVSAYFDEVMRHQFLPSGRVQYFPMCEYQGNKQFVSILTGQKYQVNVRKKIVDATYLKTSVPSTHTPSFSIAEGVRFMPLNDLPSIQTPPEGFVVIGGGKTGIDACLWLLEQQVDPDKITWIVSRDAWLIDRMNTQPTLQFFEQSVGSMASQFEAVAQATSVADLFERLEAVGVLVRLDPDVKPKMFHGATVSQMELRELRRIKNVVRMGRVQSIEKEQIVLAHGSIPTSINHIHVDCSASAITNLNIVPIFTDNLITPQTVRPYQPVFSAAFIAHVEATYETDEAKNELCAVVPLPNHDTDWIRTVSVQLLNQYRWSQDRSIRHWLRDNRLDGFSKLLRSIDREDAPKQAILKRLRESIMPAAMNIQRLMEEINQEVTG